MGIGKQNLNREAILMLYAAGELSVQDRAELQELLAADGVLRQEYEQLLAAQQTVASAFEQADATHPLPAPQMSSVYRVTAAMKQWRVDQLARPSAAPSRHGRHFGWPHLLAGLAAIIIITVSIFWSRVDTQNNMPPDQGVASDVDGQGSDNSADKSLPDDSVEQAVAESPDSYTPAGGGDIDRQLSSAEREVGAINYFTDSLRTPEEAGLP